MEARHHNQRDPARHPITSQRAKPRISSAGRRIQPIQEGPPGIREESAEYRQGESSAVDGREE